MNYQHKCVRCGYCCLYEPCLIAKLLFEDYNQCAMLTFNGDISHCGFAGVFVPIGDGCCIKARAIKDGITYDFAALPRSLKYIEAQRLRKGVENGMVKTKWHR